MRQQIFASNGLTLTSQKENPQRIETTQRIKIGFICCVVSIRWKKFRLFCKDFSLKRITWLGIFFLSVAVSTRAGEVVPYTLAQRTQKAEVIVVAEVETISSAWNDQGNLIFTYVKLNVLEKIKGNFAGTQIMLQHLGGVVGNVEYHVSGVPQFSRNERVLVFLGRIPNSSYFGVMDWLEGKKTIQNDAAGQQMIRVGAKGEKSQSLKEYLNEIKSLLKQK